MTMNTYSKPIIRAALALALMGTTAYAAGGGGSAGGTTSPNATATPGSVQTPKPTTTATPSNANGNTVMRDPAPGNKQKANPPHIIQRDPPRTDTHARTTPSETGSGNPG